MRHLVTIALVIAGVIHLLPLSGVLGAPRLSSLYGIALAEPNLLILMRHRAVLFGLLGCFMLFAAFKPTYQLIALIVGLISVVSFLWLALAVGEYNRAIGRVVTADVIALVGLLLGVAAYVYANCRA